MEETISVYDALRCVPYWLTEDFQNTKSKRGSTNDDV